MSAVGDAIVILLPVDPSADAAVHWWRIAAGAVADEGTGAGWQDAGLPVIALAPTGQVRLHIEPIEAETASIRQAAAVARLGALEHSLGDPETLHAVAAPIDSGGRLAVAVVANEVMLGWLEWADRAGCRLDAIVPAAMALPRHDGWMMAVVGNDPILAGEGRFIADEPALRVALLPDGAVPETASDDELWNGIASLVADPVPNLRTGRFAPRRVLVDRGAVRQAGLLILAIIAVTTLIAIVEIVRLDRSTRALDAETLALASRSGGPGLTIESAEAEVAARSAGAFSAPLAGLAQRLQAEPSVTIANLGFAGGTLTATLAAPDTASINRVLLAVQRDGWRVSAVARQGSDGRNMADVTMRSGA